MTTNTEMRRFSHSLINSYLDCARKTYYRYVEQIPSPRSGALIKGSAIDEAANYDLTQKMDTKEDIDLESFLEFTEDAFRQEVDKSGGTDNIDWGRSNARHDLDAALRMGKAWLQGLAPAIVPTTVQGFYTKELPSGRQFVGYTDFEGYIDGTAAIGDNKTARRRMNSEEADKDLQPSSYAWLKDEPSDFAFMRVVDLKSAPVPEIVWTDRSEGDIAWYGELVDTVEKAWEAGIFPPNPRSFMCGPTKCPFWERCMPAKTIHPGITGTA